MRFRYALDPLCLTAMAAYLACRYLIKPYFPTGFWHDYATDTLLIPAALPWVLWVQRKLHLRTHDAYPTTPEFWLHLMVWAVLFEGLGPLLLPVTRDWWDIAAYVAGALGAGLWWWWASKIRPAATLY